MNGKRFNALALERARHDGSERERPVIGNERSQCVEVAICAQMHHHLFQNDSINRHVSA